jgi:hypothetical protein
MEKSIIDSVCPPCKSLVVGTAIAVTALGHTPHHVGIAAASVVSAERLIDPHHESTEDQPVASESRDGIVAEQTTTTTPPGERWSFLPMETPPSTVQELLDLENHGLISEINPRVHAMDTDSLKAVSNEIACGVLCDSVMAELRARGEW